MYKSLANTLFLGKQVIYMPTCHSTNDIAVKLLEKPDTHEGCIVICDNQTAGRGQRGNTWVSTPGLNLTYSIILKPTSVLVKDQFIFNMTISLSLFDVLDKILPNEEVKIKWPNDILVNGNKIAGILIENALEPPLMKTAVVGIGMNINQKHFSIKNVTSLALLMNMDLNLEHLLENLILSLEVRYMQLKSGNYDLIKEAYLNNLLGYLETRSFYSEHQFRGTIIGISQEGQLEVQEGRAIKKFDLKEIKFL